MQVDVVTNNKIFKLIQMNSHECLLLKSLEAFYLINNNKVFVDILQNNSNISIRLIDYFVTKYSKKHKISYKIDDIIFNVSQSYKQQLKQYQKKYFDPFARGTRIPYFFMNDCIITTIRQLNFFKWFISKKVLDYIIINKDAVELDMNLNKKKQKNGSSLKKKTNNLNIDTKIINTTNTAVCKNKKSILVSFI